MAETRHTDTDEAEARRDKLAHAPVGKLLMQFALPSIVAMTATSIYNLCDSFFIGRGAGALAIAGLAITFPIMNIVMAFALLSSTGSVRTSLAMGRGDRDGARRIFGNVFAMGLCTGLTLMLVGELWLDPLLRLFGASASTLPYAHQYMRVYLLVLPIGHTLQGMTAQMRAIGHPRLAMRIQLCAVGINIMLDALFILGLGWGIRGAALATVIAESCAWVWAFIILSDSRKYVHFCRGFLHLDMPSIRSIMSIGISPFSMNICGCLVVAFLNHSLLVQGGADGDMCVGAYGISHRISHLVIMMTVGFGQGMQPIVGFNYGARSYDRVWQTLRYTIVVATVIMTVGYAVMAIFPARLASIFVSDDQMVRFCVDALRISLCTFPLVGSQMIANSFFQAIGKARISMLVSLSRQLLFLLPLLVILPPLMGLDGVWWSMPIADCFSIILAWSLLLHVRKKMALMQ